MIRFSRIVEEMYAKDNRYKPDGYEFVIEALHFSQKKLKKTGHLTGRELAQGARDLALDHYGPMAKAVLTHWGIHKTIDIGNIVYNMISAKLLSKTDGDSLEDFNDVYDFETSFKDAFIKSPSETKKNNKKGDKKTLQNQN
ncbi:MAG: hypothetical protein A2Y00_11000 [Omnitrophica WOR_2 bacterium GWF2_43_52]|nr:MAG: hypothetical protein A2062_02845 [Omnitrophica WOR_2 bacterium GWA2_44_7]OGX15480.1 MAG: hypothetical protein A2Y01_01225 [Omnitrophica WOR_2 bacterium GWC2_44_8]OGX20813.1 MAG: hypothetical protein A2Y00_11000 [Omnitrophica WOR_2 bacterium GWF2_43_52]OGX54567.1 MAG: hypothetical protein A2460_04220 [Omnitrophica WOR_2 bacterium RIFOXYC2_FULL_43_9]HAH19844.1 hypothetical protein [Candidatus Omnitrophota bacterium]